MLDQDFFHLIPPKSGRKSEVGHDDGFLLQSGRSSHGQRGNTHQIPSEKNFAGFSVSKKFSPKRSASSPPFLHADSTHRAPPPSVSSLGTGKFQYPNGRLSPSSGKGKWFLVGAMVFFVTGFIAGFPLGRFVTLDEQIIRYPDGVSPNPVKSTGSSLNGLAAGVVDDGKKEGAPTIAGKAEKNQPSIAVQFTNQSIAPIYIVRVGEYASENLEIIRLGLKNIFSAGNTTPCQLSSSILAGKPGASEANLGAREVIFVSPKKREATEEVAVVASRQTMKQLFVGCFDDLNQAKYALQKIRVFSSSAKIFRLKE